MRTVLVIAVVAALNTCNALECYTGKLDCYNSCENASQTLNETDTDLSIEQCSFQDGEWNCSRSYSNCKHSLDCAKGLLKTEIQTCQPGENFCVDEYRRPQNSRYGKTPVWGFEAVHVLGCASSCTNVTASKDTGVGMLCCTTDLCNPASISRPTLVLVALATYVAFLS